MGFLGPWSSRVKTIEYRRQTNRAKATETIAVQSPTRRRDYALLLDLLRPYWRQLAFALFMMLVHSATWLAMPWLAGRFSAALAVGAPVGDVLVLWLGLVVVQAALGYAIGLRTQGVAIHLIADGSSRVFDHLQSLPLSWHQDRRRGDVLSLMTEDVARLGYFVTHTITPLLPLLVTCAGAFFLMLRIEPRIGLAMAILVPVIFVAMRWAGRRLRPLANEAAEAYALKSAIAEESLAMIPVVKAYLGEPAESSRFAAQGRRLRNLEMRQVRLQDAIEPMVRVGAATFVMGLLWFSSRSVASGAMTAAELVSLLLYGLLLTQPVSQLASVYGQVQTARGTAKRLISAFAADPEPDDGPGELTPKGGQVSFENVTFSHPGRAVVLDRMALHIQDGETVAITVENGAGKSTLVHLLMRFSDPESGTIRIDGTDIREVTLKSLRSQIALVSQNVLLFNASVAENIAYGYPEASQEQIEAASRSARAHDFIQLLPKGYDTEVGDQGIRLSGGQKQRIALARALIKNPAILVLDEATAMFDPQGELDFIAQCRELMAERTVLLITHRPASLALADRIVRLERGRIAAGS